MFHSKNLGSRRAVDFELTFTVSSHAELNSGKGISQFDSETILMMKNIINITIIIINTKFKSKIIYIYKEQ